MTAAQVLLKKFNSAKTLPHVAIRLTKLISDENGSMQDFEKIINKTAEARTCHGYSCKMDFIGEFCEF